MKLLTHNFLSSRFLKDAKVGYPLVLRCSSKETIEPDFNDQFVKTMMAKIDYAALRSAAEALGESGNLPDSLPEDTESYSVDLLKELHRVLFCIEVIDGELECPDTGRVFPIKDGIPNMLCSENEVA